MSERLPYEEELSRRLNDLPLPDEHVSWDDMKRRLDEDNDDGIIIPPLKRGCGGYILLLLVLAVTGWLIVRPGKGLWHKNQKDTVSSKEAYNNRKDSPVSNTNIKNVEKITGQPRPPVAAGKGFDSGADYNKEHKVAHDLLKLVNEKDIKQKIPVERDSSKNKYAGNKGTQRKSLQESITDNNLRRNKSIRNINKKIPGGLKSETLFNAQSDSSKNDTEIKAKGRDSTIINDPINIEAATKKTVDSNAIKKKTKDIDIPGKIAKQDSGVKANKPVYFAAGVALHQLLPVNGQKLVPYNSLGRKSTLADYIPSLYFRMYKDQKWFLQSEFRYGAPQYTKEILYVQKKVIDTFTRTTLATSNRLKKTFYHQLPVSFNYFVLPHFSIGLGFVWNKFSSAVSERKVVRTNNVTLTDSIQAQTIFYSKKADSNFVKSYFQALFETQGQWKRWSLGARYSFGLQPYIRFRLPGGAPREEKNSTLQVFLRYNLWESKKK